jgi:hypothetical protein
MGQNFSLRLYDVLLGKRDKFVLLPSALRKSKRFETSYAGYFNKCSHFEISDGIRAIVGRHVAVRYKFRYEITVLSKCNVGPTSAL